MHIKLITASECPYHEWASPCVREEGWVLICLLWDCVVFVDSNHVFTSVCFWKMSLFPNKKGIFHFFVGIRLFVVIKHDRRLATEDLEPVWLPRSKRTTKWQKTSKNCDLGQKIMNCDVMCCWRLPVGLLISWNGINCLGQFCKVIISINWQLHVVPGCLNFALKLPSQTFFGHFRMLAVWINYNPIQSHNLAKLWNRECAHSMNTSKMYVKIHMPKEIPQ